MKEKYKNIVGHNFIVKSEISTYNYTEYKFEETDNNVFIKLSWIFKDEEKILLNADSYSYEEAFDYIKDGTWKILSKRHLLTEIIKYGI